MMAVLALFTTWGCASASSPPPEACPTEPPPPSAVEPLIDGSAPAPGVTAVAPVLDRPSVERPAESRWAVQHIDQPTPPLRIRPRRVGRRDVRFEGAPLGNALRLLAETGRFDLVLDGDFSQPISQVLRNVEPYDALLVLAEAHGAQVTCRATVVTVTAR